MLTLIIWSFGQINAIKLRLRVYIHYDNKLYMFLWTAEMSAKHQQYILSSERTFLILHSLYLTFSHGCGYKKPNSIATCIYWGDLHMQLASNVGSTKEKKNIIITEH